MPETRQHEPAEQSAITSVPGATKKFEADAPAFALNVDKASARSTDPVAMIRPPKRGSDAKRAGHSGSTVASFPAEATITMPADVARCSANCSAWPDISPPPNDKLITRAPSVMAASMPRAILLSGRRQPLGSPSSSVPVSSQLPGRSAR